MDYFEIGTHGLVQKKKTLTKSLISSEDIGIEVISTYQTYFAATARPHILHAVHPISQTVRQNSKNVVQDESVFEVLTTVDPLAVKFEFLTRSYK